jgi:hypothetical protein
VQANIQAVSFPGAGNLHPVGPVVQGTVVATGLSRDASLGEPERPLGEPEGLGDRAGDLGDAGGGPPVAGDRLAPCQGDQPLELAVEVPDGQCGVAVAEHVLLEECLDGVSAGPDHRVGVITSRTRIAASASLSRALPAPAGAG